MSAGMPELPGGNRLLNKADVIAVCNISFPTILNRMKAGRFPLARESVNGHLAWIEAEIYEFIHSLPIKQYSPKS